MYAFGAVGIGGTKGLDTTYLKIFVGNLTPNRTSLDLYQLFAPFGLIREAVVIPNRFRTGSRRFGFVKWLHCICFNVMDKKWTTCNTAPWCPSSHFDQVTFADSSSVQRVLCSLPMTNKNGDPLTVKLAASDPKPRKAKFTVKHGGSGHGVTTRQTEDAEKALLRTANIQSIKPAKLELEDIEEFGVYFRIPLITLHYMRTPQIQRLILSDNESCNCIPMYLSSICGSICKCRIIRLREHYGSEQSSCDFVQCRPLSNDSSLFSSTDPDYSLHSRGITPELNFPLQTPLSSAERRRKYEDLVKINVSGQCPVGNQRHSGIEHCTNTALLPIFVTTTIPMNVQSVPFQSPQLVSSDVARGQSF